MATDTKEPGGMAIHTIRAPSDLTDVQRSGLEFFASVYAEEMTQVLVQGLVARFSTDALIVKFLEAWMLDYELLHENEPDGPLGRHLDTFIEKRETGSSPRSPPSPTSRHVGRSPVSCTCGCATSSYPRWRPG